MFWIESGHLAIIKHCESFKRNGIGFLIPPKVYFGGWSGFGWCGVASGVGGGFTGVASFGSDYW